MAPATPLHLRLSKRLSVGPLLLTVTLEDVPGEMVPPPPPTHTGTAAGHISAGWVPSELLIY